MVLHYIFLTFGAKITEEAHTMSKEEKIKLAFEELHQKADKSILYAFYIFLPALFLAGAMYRQPVLALVGCLITGAILYVAMNYGNSRTQRNILVTMACTTSVFFLLFVTKGITEARFSYFAFLYLLTLYRDRTPIGMVTVLSLTYLVVAFTVVLTDNTFAGIAKMYLLEAQAASVERFVFSTGFTIFANAGAFMVVDALRKESLNAIENEIIKETELKNYQQNREFADEIAQGNFNASYISQADDLGKALLNMRENLKKADEKDDQERFISETTTEVGEILRQSTQDIELLTDRVLHKLIQRMDASQGAIYLAEGNQDDLHLEMVACYAYNRKKFLHHRIELGEGLVGQTFLERLPTFITKVPAQYKAIEAGLGEIIPNSIFIVPLKVNDNMVGVLEMAFLREIPLYERTFLEKIADNIASTLITARNNEETQILYQQAQLAAEELRTREEEMRQNMEELKTTQEEMQRTQTAMQESQMKSQAIFDGSINSIIIFNEQGWIEEINPATETMFGYDRNHVSNMKIENLFEELYNGFEGFIGIRSGLTAKKRNGETFAVQAFLNRFMIGSRSILLMYSRDNTKDIARKRENEAKMKQLELAKQQVEEQLSNAKIRELQLQTEIQKLREK